MNNIKAMTELRLKNINSNTINAIEDNMPPNKPSKVLLGLISVSYTHLTLPTKA